MDLFKLGKDKETGKIVEVSEVDGGLDCNCVCPNCGKDLVAAQGKKTEWYFRHHENTDCNTGPEKGIQALAKEILTANSRIKLPEIGTIKYEKPQADKKSLFFSFVPEVSAQIDGENLYFDIKVNPDDDKTDSYKDEAQKSVEIDLTDYVYTSKDELRKDILSNPSNKKIIHWNEETPAGETKSLFTKTIPVVFGLLGAGIVLGAIALSRRSEEPEPLSATEKALQKSKAYLKDSGELLEKPKELWESSKDILDKPKELWGSSRHLLDKPMEILEHQKENIKDFSQKLLDKYKS